MQNELSRSELKRYVIYGIGAIGLFFLFLPFGLYLAFKSSGWFALISFASLVGAIRCYKSIESIDRKIRRG
jgi:hypothetical protein